MKCDIADKKVLNAAPYNLLFSFLNKPFSWKTCFSWAKPAVWWLQSARNIQMSIWSCLSSCQSGSFAKPHKQGTIKRCKPFGTIKEGTQRKFKKRRKKGKKGKEKEPKINKWKHCKKEFRVRANVVKKKTKGKKKTKTKHIHKVKATDRAFQKWD